MRNLKAVLIAFLAVFTMIAVVSVNAQTVLLYDQFDGGDTNWDGWIDTGSATVTASIDATGKLSGDNSYLLDVVSGSADTWRVQRNTDIPLTSGMLYTVSFLAVADAEDAQINVLFEIDADPWTKRINEMATVGSAPEVFTYTYASFDDVANNELKLHFGGQSGVKIWVDSVTVTEQANPALVAQWGLANEYSTLWPINNDAATPAGSGSMGQEFVGGWKGLQGKFDPLAISATEAVVVKGELEFVGADGGDAYTVIRYALTNQESDLENALTDSAKWSVSGGHTGYGFHPRTGNGTMSNGNGGAGTVWEIGGGNWASTWSNNGVPVAAVNQQPRNAEIIEGTYDFAVSVNAVNDSTNEVRWYLVEKSNKYWFGGISEAKATSDTFNSIIFGVNEAEFTQINVANVTAELGDPITVPEAPWEAYYVDLWGLANEYSTVWPILNDSTTLVGDASMGGEVQGGWKGLQGGLGQNVAISTDQAIILEGQIEFVGADAGDSYTPIRYALTRQDSSELQNAGSDSAKWSRSGLHHGYGFHPRTGNGTTSNGNGGAGNVWTIGGGNWASTWSNAGGPVVTANQQPRNAVLIEGTYDFAISVHSVNDTTNEVRWYMIEEGNKYWFGGSAQAPSTTKEFNSIIFGVNEVEYSQFNVIAMQVDKGNPIDIPEPPWEAYYVDQWGLANEYSTIWPILNDSTTLVGDASMGGEVQGGWKGLQGGLGQNVSISADKAIIIEGQIEFVGADAGDSYTPIRYAFTRQDSSELQNAGTDSAKWSRSGLHHGYGFHPRTGNGTTSNGAGGSGHVWTIGGGNWASTWSNQGGPVTTANQQPRNAVIIEGTYDFAISVHSINDTTNEVRWYMIEEDNSYWFGGTAEAEATTKEFNSIIFGVNEVEYTQFNVIAMQVDKGDPIDVPRPPWQDHYIGQWGFVGDRMGGWDFTPGEFTGNATISGDEPSEDWAAIQGGFDVLAVPEGAEALVIEGKMELEGGGFDIMNRLRFGVFYGDDLGSVDTTDYTWSGSEDAHSGYLFIPHHGSHYLPEWPEGSGTMGTWGAVSDDVWFNTDGADNYPLGTEVQYPDGAKSAEGTYEFELSIAALEDGSNDVRFQIMSEDGSYGWAVKGIDATPVTDQYNCFCVALGKTNSTTALNLVDVEASYGDTLDITVSVNSDFSMLPKAFELNQNYPNPFNPTTTIDFALPLKSDVKITVYDVQGRAVRELVNENLRAGYHTVEFDASDLATGVYFYKLKAENKEFVKKLMLVK